AQPGVRGRVLSRHHERKQPLRLAVRGSRAERMVRLGATELVVVGADTTAVRMPENHVKARGLTVNWVVLSGPGQVRVRVGDVPFIVQASEDARRPSSPRSPSTAWEADARCVRATARPVLLPTRVPGPQTSPSSPLEPSTAASASSPARG